MFREFDYDNKPVVDIVNEIIEDSIKKGASDIHFDPDEKVINVRIRIDGELHDYCKIPESVKKNLITRVKIISGMNITEFRLPQDGAIKHLDDGKQLDLRVSSLPTIYGEKIVIRILDYSMSLSGLDTLGFSEHNLNLVKRVIASPNGIILTAGATGSGKSTTTYSILQKLNTPERNIITVEDPVEMKMKGLNQVQVMSEIGLDFNATLRSILRQDPDIIMIGEIRDGETARIAVRASITGHLVLSTIHTNNSLNTIERLLDMDIERYLLGTALNGVISQRLVKRLCPKCRKSRPANAYEKNLFKKVLNKDVESIYEPVGCDDCFGGYRGRLAVHEVLVLNQAVRDAITNNMRKEDLRRLVYDKKNTFTILEDGLEKVIQGLTSVDEVIRITSLEDDFGADDEEIKNAFIGNDLNVIGFTNKEIKEEQVQKQPEDIHRDIIDTL
ncbi:MAG: type II/IV secretion system protein [Bacilli bacterium]|nr:type II/IV secretion system protein [Bacilli bacterium]